MFGGTPSNLAISVMNGAHVEVVAGINLPMLIKLASVRDAASLEQAVNSGAGRRPQVYLRREPRARRQMTGADDAPAPLIREIAIINRKGLHARATAKFVQCVEAHDAIVTVTRQRGDGGAGTSIMGILTLGAGTGSTILVSARGTAGARGARRADRAHLRQVRRGRIGGRLRASPIASSRRSTQWQRW